MNPTTRTNVVSGPRLAPRPAHENVAAHLPRTALARPDRAAVIEPNGRRGWRVVSYAELDQRVDAIAHGLSGRGVARGDRVALFVRPGSGLIAITFALFKLGAVPVLLDPGMGRKNVVACLARVRPRVFVGVPLAHVVRALHARALPSIEIAVVVGRAPWPGLESLAELARPSAGPFACTETCGDETAAILFTSGSTGPPKGVEYAHGMFGAQIEALRATYGFRPGERDLACFPLFALFDAALQTTCVIPRIDASRPGRCAPEDVADAILSHGCTYGFGSPAIWRRVGPWAIENGVRFPTLERVMIAGAPVPPWLIDALRTRLDRGDVHTPYGATECLPVSTISGSELQDGLRARVEGGHGSCVGRPVPGIEIAILPVTEDAVTNFDDAQALGAGIVGEIVVSGDVVTRAYADDARATARAKIRDGDRVWHRTGDAGYFDEDGRLWTVGRTAHRIETPTGVRWPVPIENVCDLHPRAARTALVSWDANGCAEPCLVVEPREGEWPRDPVERAVFADEMRALARAKLASGAPFEVPLPRRFAFHRAFPTDARHNAKIRREDLARFVASSSTVPHDGSES